MAERFDEWPRVHTCLYNWCPKHSDECNRCDGAIQIMRSGQHNQHLVDYYYSKIVETALGT